MQESFLHYVWRYLKFNQANLVTLNGKPIKILAQGIQNTNAGPDFENARIIIDNLEWCGPVEIHETSSDWIKHCHNKDSAYDNVILHVVWQHNTNVYRQDGSEIETLTLKDIVEPSLIDNFLSLKNSVEPIPCSIQVEKVKPFDAWAMVDKALMNRLERKKNIIDQHYQKTNANWEEVAYRTLLIGVGFKVNSMPMEQLGILLPFKVIKKHVDNLFQLEALLFGVSGLLQTNEVEDSYFTSLKKEFHHLSAMYNLDSKCMNASEWKFLRLRPANFPTLRIAQVAAFLHKKSSLFRWLIEVPAHKELSAGIRNTTSPYWQIHYRFNTVGEKVPSKMGKKSFENLVINVVVPLLISYSKIKLDDSLLDRAIRFLEAITPEKNNIINNWESLGLTPSSSAQSQGLIELYNEFCIKKRCLDCNIGFKIINKPQ